MSKLQDAYSKCVTVYYTKFGHTREWYIGEVTLAEVKGKFRWVLLEQIGPQRRGLSPAKSDAWAIARLRKLPYIFGCQPTREAGNELKEEDYL